MGLSRTVKLKGYRAGHVARRLVERYFGDDVKKDVAQKLVAGSIHEALEGHKPPPVAAPRVENGDVKPGEPFKYVATVEVRPRVEPKDYAGLSAPKVDVNVTDEAVEARLEEIRRDQSMFVPVEGREVVELGDYAVAEYEGFVDGAPLRGARRRRSPSCARRSARRWPRKRRSGRKVRSARRSSPRWWRRTPSRRRRRWSSATSTPCCKACWKGSTGAGSTFAS